MMLLVVPWILTALAQLTPSPDVRPIPISGVVIDESGQPVKDAEVWLTRANRTEDDRKSGMELSWMTLSPSEEESVHLDHTRTDAQGQFRLEMPIEIAARPDPIAVAVWATHLDRRAATTTAPPGRPARRSHGPAPARAVHAR